MEYKQLFEMIKAPENKVFKNVIAILGGLENIKYSLRGEKKILLYALGSEAGKYAPEWVMKAVFVCGEKQSYSQEQIVAIFDALHNRYSEDEKKQAMILQHNQKVL